MANLKYGEKDDLEALLGMRTGYVLDFTNRQFREFVIDSVRLDIDDPMIGGNGSKASRLRHFWSNQPDHIVGRLLRDLIERAPDENATLRKRCAAAAERLSQSAAVHDASVISELSDFEDFEHLAAGIRNSLEKNEPEAGLDRLHTLRRVQSDGRTGRTARVSPRGHRLVESVSASGSAAGVGPDVYRVGRPARQHRCDADLERV